MQTKSFFGYKCPNCNSTIDIAAVAGSNKLLCPNCKTEMVPNPDGKTVSANVYCKKCNSSFGLINSDKCPNCGSSFLE